MKRILITGGSGYVGSHICKVLSEASYEVLNYDINRNQSSDKYSEFVQGEITNTNYLIHTMREFKPDLVIHLAALIKVDESLRLPEKYYNINTLGTLAVLQAMKAERITNIIFASTAAVYGIENDGVPISESHILEPLSVYGRSKLFAEKIIEDCAKAGDLNYIIFRFFNAVGTDDDLQIGFNNQESANLLPRAIQSAVNKHRQLEIFGTDYDTRDGTAIRDYVHVMDIAKAHLKAIELIERRRSVHEILNLGSEEGVSVNEIVHLVETCTKKRINSVYASRREGDLGKVVASSKRAKDLLDWEASENFLERAIHSSSQWYQNNKD